MTLDLAGVAAKIYRASEHLNTLRDEVGAFDDTLVEGQSYLLANEFEPQTGHNVRRVHLLTEIPSLRWGVLVGELSHQLRSTLDHLVEALTVENRGYPLDGTEFPIFAFQNGVAAGPGGRSVAGFKDAGRQGGQWKIRGLQDADRRFVEGLQPYHRTNDVPRHPLWLLHKLWNMDKHRTVPLVVLAAGSGGFVMRPGQVFDGSGGGFVLGPGDFAFEDGAVVLRATPGALGVPFEDVDVNFHLTREIAFEVTGPGQGRAVIPVLSECLCCVIGILCHKQPSLAG